MRQTALLSCVAIISQVLLISCTIGPVNTGYVENSRGKQYTSIQQLNADSIAVIQVTATSNQRQDPEPGPFVTTDVHVDHVIRGVVSGQVIKIRQLASLDPKVVVEDSAALLQPGKSYVLFVMPAKYGSGNDIRDTGEYTPVGISAGVFQNLNGTLLRLDRESPKLPARVALSDMLRAVTP